MTEGEIPPPPSTHGERVQRVQRRARQIRRRRFTGISGATVAAAVALFAVSMSPTTPTEVTTADGGERDGESVATDDTPSADADRSAGDAEGEASTLRTQSAAGSPEVPTGGGPTHRPAAPNLAGPLIVDDSGDAAYPGEAAKGDRTSEPALDLRWGDVSVSEDRTAIAVGFENLDAEIGPNSSQSDPDPEWLRYGVRFVRGRAVVHMYVTIVVSTGEQLAEAYVSDADDRCTTSDNHSHCQNTVDLPADAPTVDRTASTVRTAVDSRRLDAALAKWGERPLRDDLDVTRVMASSSAWYGTAVPSGVLVRSSSSVMDEARLAAARLPWVR